MERRAGTQARLPTQKRNMKTELKFSDVATVKTELLVVFAFDHSTSKDTDAKAEVALLTRESLAQYHWT